MNMDEILKKISELEDKIKKQEEYYNFFENILLFCSIIIILIVVVWYFNSYKPLIENNNIFFDYINNQEKEVMKIYKNCILNEDKYYCVGGDK